MKNIIMMIIFTFMFMGCSNANYAPDSWSDSEPTGDASVFLRGAYIDAEEVRKKLEFAGFEILTNYESITDGVTIVFTNSALKKEAAKPFRAHIATMRIFVDKKEQMISITNPVYFGKAFMQEDYNYKIFADIKMSLSKLFTGLVHSANARQYSELDGYRLNTLSPNYKKFEVLAENSNEDLLYALRIYKNEEKLLYTLKLSNDTTLVGYDIGKKVKRMVKIYGRQNAGILPYEIVVSNKKATALAARYYFPLYYNQLTVAYRYIRDFKNVRSDLKKPFNK